MKLSLLLKPRWLLTAAISVGGMMLTAFAAPNPNYGIWDPDNSSGYGGYAMAYKGWLMPTRDAYILSTNAWGALNAAVADDNGRCGYQVVKVLDRNSQRWAVEWGFANNRKNNIRVAPQGKYNSTLKAYYAAPGSTADWVTVKPETGRLWTRVRGHPDYVRRNTTYIKSYPSLKKAIGRKVSDISRLPIQFEYWLNDKAMTSKAQYKVMHELVFHNSENQEKARFQIEILNRGTGNTSDKRRIEIDGGTWRLGKFGTFPSGKTPVYTLSLRYDSTMPANVGGSWSRLTIDAVKYVRLFNRYSDIGKVNEGWVLSAINSGIEIIAGPKDSQFNCEKYIAKAYGYSNRSAYTLSTLSTLSEETTELTTTAPDVFVASEYLEMNPDVAAHDYFKYHPEEHWVRYGRSEGRYPNFAARPADEKTFVAAEYLAMYPDVAAHPYFKFYPEEHWMSYGGEEGRYPSFAARDLVELEDNSAPRTIPDLPPASYEENSTDPNFQPNSILDYKLVSESTGGVLAITENFGSNNQPLEQQNDNRMLWQRWRLEPLGNGYLRIINRQTGKVLDANPDGSWTVKQWDYVDSAIWHQWRLIPCGNNLYKIQNRYTGKFITVGNLSDDVESSIGQWTDVGYNAGQMFRLVAEFGSAENADQKYLIQSKAVVDVNRSYVLDLLYADANNFAKIGQCNWWGGENQKWIFDSLPDSRAMVIRNAATSTVVDGDMSGYGVKMWSTYSDVDWHDWVPEHLGGGYYRIINVYTGQFLTMGHWSINAWSPNDQSATLIQYPWYGNPGQIWRFGKVD